MKPDGWIGVDLDGTLAEYHGWRDMHVGQPIAPMLARVKQWLSEGKTVKIFTARVGPAIASPHNGTTPEADSQRKLIEDWCEKHIGQKLEVTATKDFAMIELWDDRAKQVLPNDGRAVEELFGAMERRLLVIQQKYARSSDSRRDLAVAIYGF